MTFGFIICVYVGILVLAMLVRGRQSGADLQDDAADEAFDYDTHPGVYDELLQHNERWVSEDYATDGETNGLI